VTIQADPRLLESVPADLLSRVERAAEVLRDALRQAPGTAGGEAPGTSGAEAEGTAGRLGVAFSGGVDSSVLLALAARTVGAENVTAILGVSPSLAASERRTAHGVADAVGVEVVEIETYEGERPEYRANGADRCYYCKDELFTRIDDNLAAAHGLVAIAYGENADDARRLDRPGALAATRHRVLRPLAEAGLDKTAVRGLARAWGVPSADKPAAPCLASRIPHGDEVTAGKLRQIDQAEEGVRRLGFGELRIRHHGEIARLELPAADLARAVSDPLRTRVQAAIRAAGFRYAVVDLAGMQSGMFTLTALAQGAPIDVRSGRD
jgi:pyridinium-3,5-biscarboxylic acid mononucleotide sulfurtransferase